MSLIIFFETLRLNENKSETRFVLLIQFFTLEDINGVYIFYENNAYLKESDLC